MPSRLPCLIVFAAATAVAPVRPGSAEIPFLNGEAPLLSLARAFGFRVEADLYTSRLRLVSPAHEIVLALGLPRALVDGKGLPLLEAPRCLNGQVLAGPDLADLIRRLGAIEPAQLPSRPRGRAEPGEKPRLSSEQPVGFEMLTGHLAGFAGVKQKERSAAPKIVLDPGHGGHDDGARTRNGTKEKDVVLDIAKKAAVELRRLGAHVVLTREDDRYVELRARAAVAASVKADAFLSIHTNSHQDRHVSGVETWVAGPNSHRPRECAYRSLALARAVQEAIVRELSQRDRGVREGNYTVLREVTVPAALVELGFLSNPDTERVLTDPVRSEAIACALARALFAVVKDWR